jgi:hypothetical protein
MGHIPERTCLACGRKAGKADLLRIARNKEGKIAIDLHQHLPGRGGYVCRTLACGVLLKKKKGLDHGFRRPVPSEIYTRVIEFLREYDST